MSTGIDIQGLEEIASRVAQTAPDTRVPDLSYTTQQLTDLPQIDEARFGLLASWEELLDADPTGTLFQGPVWCLEWYRTYYERYEPRILTVSCGGALVGLVPLAVERATGELVFASANMCDYRDVLAVPQHKQIVVEEFLRFYQSNDFNQQSLWLGPMLPESITAQLALDICKHMRGLDAIPRSHVGWRWWPVDDTAKEFLKKKSVRQAIKHYQRRGQIRLDRIDTVEAWRTLKQEFFDQHSLRQVYVGRPLSFNDSMKQSFYDALISNHPESVHFVALRVNDRIVATHYGPVRDRVLYWGAPAFDIREARHSPGLVLLALIIQDAEHLGLRGIDLTIGVEEYKKRFSNSRVDLPSVSLYRQRRRYYSRVIRDAITSQAKLLVTKFRGPDGWDPTKAQLDKLAERAERAKELGAKDSLKRLTRRGLNAAGERARWLTLIATAVDLQPVEPVLAKDESCEFHRDELRDMLRWEELSSDTAREIRARVQRGPADLRRGRTLHTVLVNGKLACWGWSYWPEGPELIDVIHAELAFAPNSVSLYDFYTIPKFRGRRIYQALLTEILRTRFAEGADRAYIMVQDTNVASRKAIERVGFRMAAVDETLRVLRWSRRRHIEGGGLPAQREPGD